MEIIKPTYISFSLGMLALAPPLMAQENKPDSVDSQVNVAFKTIEQDELMGSVYSVNVKQLNQKDYETYSLSNMSSFVPTNSWNNGAALVLVDGVPRDANNVSPSEIEQITYLKSASAVVLYGSRAVNGAILITTKRGRTEGLHVNVRGTATTFVPKRYPSYLDAANYMTLYNEALANDGKEAIYSDELIAKYASGENPYRYPSIDFFSHDYVKKSYQKYEGTAEFSGGGRFAHFYANIGLYHLGDLINFGEGKDNHTNRLNVRGNIDLRLNNWVTGWVNACATFSDVRSDNADYWAQSAKLRPTSLYPMTPLIPIDNVDMEDTSLWTLIQNSNHIVDAKYLLGGTQSQQTNPFADMYAAGHKTVTTRQLQFDAGVKLDLSKVLKGLSFRTQIAVDYSTTYNTLLSNSYATYDASWCKYEGNDMIYRLTKYGTDKSTGTQELTNSSEKQTILFAGQFDYNRTFDGVHHINATLLAHGYQQTITGTYHRTSNANLGIQATYNYKRRYYLDFSGAAIHSAKLAPGHRDAFSPTFSAAWRLSKESFMKDIAWIDDIKLNTSWGIVNEDFDISDYYMYDDIFTSTGTWWGWSESANSMHTSDSQRASNKNLTFIKRKEFRVGLDASLFKGDIKLSATFFNTLMNGFVTKVDYRYPNYYESYYPASSFIPYENYNNTRYTGLEYVLNLHKKLGELDLSFGATGYTYTSKNTRVSENVEYDWLKVKSQRTDAIRGYECLGFFLYEDDIANSALINSNTKQGDLKYKDQNGDGVIDSKDQVVLGHYGADFTYGLNLTAKWRNWTLFMAGNGSVGGKGIKNNSYYWVYGDGKYSDQVLGRWTKATATTATYPRLTTEGGELNFVNSSFWTYSTSRFDLTKIQLTYQFPSSLFNDGKWIKGIAVYMNGCDLLTIAKERKLLETNVGSAPQCRSYNLGLKIEL